MQEDLKSFLDTTNGRDNDDKKIIDNYIDDKDFSIEYDYYEDVFTHIQAILPYEREYETLNAKELLELIEEAKDKSWKALDLSNCGLREVPTEIGTLTELEVLDLGNSGPEDEDDLSRNLLLTLPAEIGNLKSLTDLCLHETKLKYLPKEISKLSNLTNINLNGCDFKEFPEEICELKNLCKLAINDSFTKVSEKICNLLELKELFLPESLISTLPETIGNLKKLNILYLGRSKIVKLPTSMADLENLRILDLDKSTIAGVIPPEILNQSPAEVIDYILRFQKDENKVFLNESKMIIVGQGGVGKTCLLNSLINNQYVQGASTEGIDIAQWCFKSNGKDFKLNVWDFGGQEIYHSTHQFFLTKRSFYIFVWDARQEEEYGRIDYWLNTIQSFANDSPIIIAVNKCDESRKNIKHLDINDLMSRFPQILASYDISCQDNINIDILRREIIFQAQKLPLMETLWFSSWISVRQELEVLSKQCNIIRYDEYINICFKHSIGHKEALSLIKYLHDLGVVLHFHEDMLLKSIIILSPNWGTDAVYKILDAQANILKGRNGILYSKDLPEIWNNDEIYPESTFPFILKLMENFQLSFTLEENSAFLVAELLDNNEKAMLLEFPRESTLNFRYEYNFLPAGIMTRFIVKAHTYLIDDNGVKMCWRKGAYLKYKDAYGLLRLHDPITERYLDIKVSGDNSRNRRELLAIIRSTLDQIHKSIPKIDYNEKVLCNCSSDCNYLHDYKYLNRLDANGIGEDRCMNSLKMVDILMLLEGIQIKRERKFDVPEIKVNTIINNAPVINANSHASNVNTNSISIEIKNTINELQGYFNELVDELGDADPKITNKLDKVASNIKHLDSVQTKDEVVKSGVLNKVRRFLEECSDSETSTGSIINGIGHGYSILQDIAEKYNGIAEWCGMPVVPKVFLKSSK